jgi:peptidoglycan/LPS O-acetylase OafA/YrhL
MALAVMAYHYLHYEEVVTLYAIGRYAVYSFFVLSGFSLYYVYSQRLKTMADLKSYMIKRYFRIAPLLYAVILGVLAIRIALGKITFDLAFANDLLLNFSLLFGFINPGANAIAPASWSLGIEWAFYCVFPLILIFTQGSLKRLMLATGLSLIVHAVYTDIILSDGIHLSEQWPAYIQPVNFLCYFMAGMTLAELFMRTRHAFALQWLAIAALIPLIATFILIPQSDSVAILKGAMGILMFGVAVAIVFAFAYLPISGRIFNGVSHYLGNISYAVYLFHIPAYQVMRLLKLDNNLLTVALSVISVLIGATLSYYIYERQFQKWGKSFIKDKQ